MARVGLFVVVLGLACGGESQVGQLPAPAPGPDAGDEVEARCGRKLPGPDDARKVVIGHPFEADGTNGNDYEVLDLDPQGVLTRPGVQFEMGRAHSGTIEFTPDGAIGLAAQSDGTIGVFRFEGDDVVVVDPGFAGSFFAEEVLISDDGSQALVVDPDWRKDGGGLYLVSIACDGTLTDEGQVLASKGARSMRRVPGSTQAVVTARDLGGSQPDLDLHVIELSNFGAPTVVRSLDVFADEEALSTSVAATADGRFALVGDTASFTEGGNRVGVATLQARGPTQTAISVEDPYDLLMSPYRNAVLVVSGFGDDIYAMGYDPQAKVPFSPPARLDYAGEPPAVPARGVVITRGSRAGLTLVAENVGIRQVRFFESGEVVDLGLFAFSTTGEDLTAVTSAIGIAP